MSVDDSATVVLVHGVAHGAWAWDKVVAGLQSANVAVLAVDLPGQGDDPGPILDLHGDADRVTKVVDAIDGPIVLVGHSYGAAVIAEAGVRPNVVRLVFIAAPALAEDGPAPARPGDPRRATRSQRSTRARRRLPRQRRRNDRPIRPEPAARCFYADCHPKTHRGPRVASGTNRCEHPVSHPTPSRGEPPVDGTLCAPTISRRPPRLKTNPRRTLHRINRMANRSLPVPEPPTPRHRPPRDTTRVRTPHSTSGTCRPIPSTTRRTVQR